MEKMKIAEIIVGERLRTFDPAKAREIAGSFEDRGQINPITVSEKGELLAGYHRLEAAKELEWDEVKVAVLPAAGPEAILVEIDENLVRHELKVLEKAECIVVRKAAYEAINRPVKRGGDRRSKEAKSRRQTDALKSFCKDTAQKMGTSESTVERLARIATKIEPGVKEQIRDTFVADSLSDLLWLAKLPPEYQERACREFLEGDYDSIREAFSNTSPKKPKKKPKTPAPEAPREIEGPVPGALGKGDPDTKTHERKDAGSIAPAKPAEPVLPRPRDENEEDCSPKADPGTEAMRLHAAQKNEYGEKTEVAAETPGHPDRKSTRLNSSH
jgi:ParB family chromosome partitioning protein